MREVKGIIAVLLVTALMSFGLAVNAQTVATNRRMTQMIKRLETASDSFSRSLDASLDRSRLNGTDTEDQVNALVDEFEYATDRLRERAGDNEVMTSDVENVLSRALRLEGFMQAHQMSQRAQSDWAQVRNVLNDMARSYNVAWVWTLKENPQYKDSATMRRVVNRLEDRADDFRDSFDTALDTSRLNGTDLEDRANSLVQAFEEGLDRLEDRVNRSGALTSADVQGVLQHALAIDAFMRAHDIASTRARRDWARVRANLDELAFANNVAWVWTAQPVLTNDGARQTAATRQTAQGETVGMTAGPAARPAAELSREVRHSLLSDLPYYGVFDWIQFEVQPDHTVVLNGMVTSPPDTKSRAESVVRDISGVRRVVNNIEVLPVSPMDRDLRLRLYRNIYGEDSPLFRYGVGARQSIHIIVKNGRAWLKGFVDSEADKNIAGVRARTVPGLFEVTNDLRVGNGTAY